MEDRHYISEPRPVEGTQVPTWEVDVLREGVDQPIMTVRIDNEILPPRKRKKKVVWRLPDSIDQLPKFGKEDKLRILELFKQQKKALKREKRKSQTTNSISPSSSGMLASSAVILNRQFSSSSALEEDGNPEDNKADTSNNKIRVSSLSVEPPGLQDLSFYNTPSTGMSSKLVDGKLDKKPTQSNTTNGKPTRKGSATSVASNSVGPPPGMVRANSRSNGDKMDVSTKTINGSKTRLQQHVEASLSAPPGLRPTSQSPSKQPVTGSSSNSPSKPPQNPLPTQVRQPTDPSSLPSQIEPQHQQAQAQQHIPQRQPSQQLPQHMTQHPPKSTPVPPLREFRVPPNANIAHEVTQAYYLLLTQGRVQELKLYYAPSATKSLTVGGAHAICHSAQDVELQLQSLVGIVVQIRGVLQQVTSGNGILIVMTGVCVQPHALPFCHTLVLTPTSTTNVSNNGCSGGPPGTANDDPSFALMGYQIQNDALCFLTADQPQPPPQSPPGAHMNMNAGSNTHAVRPNGGHHTGASPPGPPPGTQRPQYK